MIWVKCYFSELFRRFPKRCENCAYWLKFATCRHGMCVCGGDQELYRRGRWRSPHALRPACKHHLALNNTPEGEGASAKR